VLPRDDVHKFAITRDRNSKSLMKTGHVIFIVRDGRCCGKLA
jgi:hypothetical protein